MSDQCPANLTIAQLLRTDFPREGSIALVKHVLAADFDLTLEVFADEEEEEAGWRNDDFCAGVERSGVEVVHYICNRLDRAIPT